MDYLIFGVTSTNLVGKSCRDAAQIYWVFVGFFFVLQLLLKNTFKICQAVVCSSMSILGIMHSGPMSSGQVAAAGSYHFYSTQPVKIIGQFIKTKKKVYRR